MAEAAARALFCPAVRRPRIPDARRRSAFADLPKKSIDYAVMERTKRAAVVPADIGWSDVGNWDAVWKLQPATQSGNSIHGEGVAPRRQDVHIRSEWPADGGCGRQRRARRLDAGRRPRAGARSRRQSEAACRRPESEQRREATEHKRIYRPGDIINSIDHGLALSGQAHRREAGRSPSLQKHFHRAEHWIVVRGTAEVTLDEEVQPVHENASIFLPIGSCTGWPIRARSIWS